MICVTIDVVSIIYNIIKDNFMIILTVHPSIAVTIVFSHQFVSLLLIDKFCLTNISSLKKQATKVHKH